MRVITLAVRLEIPGTGSLGWQTGCNFNVPHLPVAFYRDIYNIFTPGPEMGGFRRDVEISSQSHY